MDAKTLALYLGCKADCNGLQGKLIRIDWENELAVIRINPDLGQTISKYCHEIKPLLRPLSSMTEEEAIEQQRLTRFNPREDWAFIKSQAEATKYLLSKGIDLFGLIEKGEAIDSTKL